MVGVLLFYKFILINFVRLILCYLKNKIFLFVTRDSDLWFVNQEGSDRPRIENSLSNLHKNRHGK